MEKRKVKILGTGKYLPTHIVDSAQLDKKFNHSIGWVEKRSGIKKRYFIDQETTSEMGAKAAMQAIENSGIEIEDIDCIISAAGIMEQPIPSTACLIQKKLGLEKSSIPAFDINATCLSFVTALDIASHLVASNKWRTILIVSSEIASKGLNWDCPESSLMFGDGAAAVIITKSKSDESSKILTSSMETHSFGTSFAELKGGGSLYYPANDAFDKEQYLCELLVPKGTSFRYFTLLELFPSFLTLLCCLHKKLLLLASYL